MSEPHPMPSHSAPESQSHLERPDDHYAPWAPFYDFVFKLVMRPGRRASSAILSKLGGRILDVGVGTGLELPMFEPHVQITGIDLSEPMLEIARKRVASHHLKNIEALIQMDALNLQFPDESFDAVVAPYVLTTVPDPIRMLNEITRVVRPGGTILLVNHIGSEKGLIAWGEGWIARNLPKLGWKPNFPWAIVGDWIKSRPDIELLEVRSLAPVGLFTLIHLRRRTHS